MSQVTWQGILEVKIRNWLTLQESIVCVAEFWITCVEKWPIRSLIPTRVEHSGQRHDGWSTEAVCNIIGAAFFVLNFQMKLLQVCGPLLMAIVLQLPLCLYELQGSVVCVDGRFFSQNVMLPLSTSLHNGIHFFVISGILLDCVRKCLTMICHWMPVIAWFVGKV